MNALRSAIVSEDELRLRMDRRTVAQQECEIRHIRQRLDKIAAMQVPLRPASKPAGSEKTLAA